MDLEIDLMFLKMTANKKKKSDQIWILQSKLHKNEVLELFLPLFVEKSYLTLKLNFDFELWNSGQEWQDVFRQILNTCILTINNEQYKNVTFQNEVQC